MKSLFLLALVSVTAVAANGNFTESFYNTTAWMNEAFPKTYFMATLDNSTVAFSLKNRNGHIFVLTTDEVFKQATWLGGDRIVLSINATNEGVAVFITDRKEQPIGLKPVVKSEQYEIEKRHLDGVGGLINVHLIAINGPTEGVVALSATPKPAWIHIHLILAVIFGVIFVMVSIRICATRILRAVYSYETMDEIECHA